MLAIIVNSSILAFFENPAIKAGASFLIHGKLFT
jgi:hypothetical protein